MTPGETRIIRSRALRVHASDRRRALLPRGCAAFSLRHFGPRLDPCWPRWRLRLRARQLHRAGRWPSWPGRGGGRSDCPPSASSAEDTQRQCRCSQPAPARQECALRAKHPCRRFQPCCRRYRRSYGQPLFFPTSSAHQCSPAPATVIRFGRL